MSNTMVQAGIRFSIIIPSYNYARFLARALDSAISQPGDDYEVIVVNDGSTDDTVSVVNAYLTKYRNVLSLR